MLWHVEQMLKETPEVESYSRRTGLQLGLSITEPHTGDFLVKLGAGAELLHLRAHAGSERPFDYSRLWVWKLKKMGRSNRHVCRYC